jgi:diguanylate cyclase (GGDEF)-like protein/PAS domain S-box-containing protein
MLEEGTGVAPPPPGALPAEMVTDDPTGVEAVLRSLARLYADFAERRETLTETLERDIGFRAAFECATDAVLIADDHGWCVDANAAACFLLGVASRDGFLNRRVSDFVALDAQDESIQGWRQLLASGEQSGEGSWQALNGESRRLAFAARANVRRGRHLLVLRDVTARRQAETTAAARARQTTFVAALGDRALAGTAWAEVAEAAVTGLADALNVPFVALYELKSGEQELLLWAGVGWGANQLRTARVAATGGFFEAVALAAAEPVVAGDFRRETRFAPSPFARGHGLAAGVALPIRGRDRRFGVLALYATEPRPWPAADLDLLRAVANVLGTTIDRRLANGAASGALRDAPTGAGPGYRALVQNAAELLMTLAPDGVVRYAGPAAERLIGLSPEELHGRELVHAVHPDDRDAFLATLAYCRAVPGDAGPVELRFIHRDGGWVWLEIVARDLTNDPRVGGILCSAREITARRRAEDTRRRGDERFGRIFRALPAGVVVTTVDEGRVLEVNERFLAMLGYERDEVVGRTALDLGIWSDPAERAALIRRLQEHGTVQELEVPVATKDGAARHGIISVGQVSLDGEPSLVVLLNDVTERKTAEGHLHRLAHSDSVTGLPNRRLFLSAVERALDQSAGLGGRRVGVLFLDLDGFKGVNDRFGHEAGDGILEEVGRRLTAGLRAGDLAARYGGDEFTVLLGRLTSENEAIAVAERVIASIAAPYLVGETRVTISASVGVAIGLGEVPAVDLVRRADIALYHAKSRGRATYALYEPGMHASPTSTPSPTAG